MSTIVILPIIFSLVLSLVISKRFSRRIYKLFNLYWLVLIVLYSVIPYGGYELSYKTYLILALFIVTINLGFILGTRDTAKVKNSVSEVRFDDELSVFLISKPVRIFCFVMFLIIVFYAVKYTVVSSIYGGVEARNLRFFVGPFFSSTVELLFYNYVISPSKYLASFILVMEIFRGKFDIRLSISCLGIVLLSSYIGGGRFELMYLLLGFLFILLMKKKAFKFNQNGVIRIDKKRLRMTVLVGLCVLVLIYSAVVVTAQRRNAQTFSFDIIIENFEILFDQFVNYNLGAVASFDVAMDKGLIENNLYLGRATLLGGLEELIQYPLQWLGVGFTSVRTQIGMVFNETLAVGSRTFNALYTALAYFYQDFGAFSVALLSLAFGYFFSRFLNMRSNSIFMMALVVHMFYQYMIMSYNWYFLSGESIMYFVYLWLFTKKGA